MNMNNRVPIKTFLDSRMSNTWMKIGPLKAYVRKGYHLLDGKVELCFDIANVQVDPKERGKGHFKQFLRDLYRELAITQIPFEYVFVECVLTHRLKSFLIREGYYIDGMNAYMSLNRNNSI